MFVAAVRDVDRLAGPDRREVPVPLVREDHPVGEDALDAGGGRARPAVRGLLHVDVEVVVHEDGAADRGDADRRRLDPERVDRLTPGRGGPRRGRSRGSSGSGSSRSDGGRS